MCKLLITFHFCGHWLSWDECFYIFLAVLGPNWNRKQKIKKRKKKHYMSLVDSVFPCRHLIKQTDQPKPNGFKPLVGNKRLQSRTRKTRTKLVFMTFLFLFFYRCVKENTSDISLMMLFFYLLNNMPSMSLKLWLWVSLESVDIAVASDVSFYFCWYVCFSF